MRLLVFCFLSLALMTVDHRQHYLDGLRAALSTVVFPVQYLANVPRAVTGWFDESLSGRQTLLDSNAGLRKQNLLLKAEVQKYAALEMENRRLRDLLHSSSKISTRTLIAELLSVDTDPFRHKITLNKGSRHGVVLGQPLLDAEGIMGQIVHVGPLSSVALLLTDPSHALPVQVNRSGLRALVVGTGSFQRLDVPYVSKNADVQVGDLLISSGLGGRFPAGYPVAQITAIDRDASQTFAKISAEPRSRLEHNREVLLIWPRPTTTPLAEVATPILAPEQTSTPTAIAAPANPAALPPEGTQE
jgi:rod shape-determining protein MreC